MKEYTYNGYMPYGAGEMFCMDTYIEDDFTGNVVQYIIDNGLGKFEIIDSQNAALVMKDYTLPFVKR